MLRRSYTVVIICLLGFALGSCNRVPDHRKYIPKDAAVVAGINLKSLGKTIAWNMITGSKLFKEMEKRVPKKNGTDIMSGIDKAGIDALNTFYVYLKTDKRFSGGIRVTGLVPLSDAGEWEGYVKTNFPQANIATHNNIKAACIGGNMYVGWNTNLLMIMNKIASPGEMDSPFGNSNTQAATDVSPEMGAEIESAFAISADNSIEKNANFEKLEHVGHDLTMWINYEQIMNQYSSEGKMGPVSLSPNLWKETALACGFDFRKGKITGDMTWHSSKEMDSVYKEFGASNANKDMVSRLPADGLDMMVALHLSTKGIKSLLNKTELLGLVNVGLGTAGIDADNLLDAFTGDMAFSMNNLKVRTVPDQFGVGQEQKAEAAMTYVIKINKKENFQKIMDIAVGTGELHPMTGGYFIPLTPHDSLYIVLNGEYCVTSNKLETAMAVLAGKGSGGKLPELAVSQATSHPFSLYFDIKQSSSNIDLGSAIPPAGAGIYDESKKLLTNLSFCGGEYKDQSMDTHLEINFTNTEESSIITLLDFGMKVSDALEKAKAESPAPDSTMLHS